MLISEILPLESVRIPFQPADKPSAIQGLLESVSFAGERLDLKPLFSAVMEREAALSTGIGGGFAVPHAKCDIAPPMLTALGVAPKGIDYGALDGKPVHFFFLILCRKDSATLHLKTLSALALLFRSESFKQALLTCLTPSEAMALIRREEAR